ncbi:MAG: hypothetical protein IPP74_14970 [Alphaproteobacteria bacterium]|nr:hypothetical protein [Alphaproteobacteria bacterium]
MSLEKRRLPWQQPLSQSATYKRVVRSEAELQAAITYFIGLGSGTSATLNLKKRFRIEIAEGFPITRSIIIPPELAFCEIDFCGNGFTTTAAISMFTINTVNVIIKNILMLDSASQFTSLVKFGTVDTVFGTCSCEVLDSKIGNAVDFILNANSLSGYFKLINTEFYSNAYDICQNTANITLYLYDSVISAAGSVYLVNSTNAVHAIGLIASELLLTAGVCKIIDSDLNNVSMSGTNSRFIGGSAGSITTSADGVRICDNVCTAVTVTGSKCVVSGNQMSGGNITTSGGAGSNTVLGNTNCGTITLHASDLPTPSGSYNT